MKCFGDNYYGQCGLGCGGNAFNFDEFGDDLPVIQFPTGFEPKMMGLGQDHTCVVSQNNSMICFGRNDVGQLGYEDRANRGECGGLYKNISDLHVIDLGTDFEISQIHIMGKHNCVLSVDVELKCFGLRTRGDDIEEMGDYLDFVQFDFMDSSNMINQRRRLSVVSANTEDIMSTMEPTMEP